MLARELLVVASLLSPAVTGDDCRRHRAIGFWSRVVCTVENCKTVNIHRVLDAAAAGGDLELARRCFDVLAYRVARRCGTAIALRTHAPPSSPPRRDVPGNASPSNEDDGAAGLPRSTTESIGTGHVHVLLAGDARSLERIAGHDSAFAWSPRDRFVVLIGRSDESRARIDGVLRTLWRERGVQNVLVDEGALADDAAARVGRLALRTYNPFARVNDSAWGRVEIIRVNTTRQASSVLSNLTERRTSNMNGYPLRVGTFDLNPSIVAELNQSVDDSDLYKGLDEAMLRTIARRMNFATRRVSPADNKGFGYQFLNGTYVGALGDVVNGRTDVCFKSFFVKKYSNRDGDQSMDFTTYVDIDLLCVVAPKAFKIPKWLRTYHLFPLSVWLCSMFFNVLTYVTWHFLRVHDPRRTGRSGTSFFATVYRMFLLNAGCPQKLPSRSAERILLAGVLLANVTLVGLLNGVLYNSFARDMYYEDIDSLEALDASELPVAYASRGVSDVFGPRLKEDAAASSSLARNLRRKLTFSYNSVIYTAYYRNVTALMRLRHFPLVSEDLIDASGAPLLHLIRECPKQYFLAYLLPKNSILREGIDVLIGRLNQAGLSGLWNHRTTRHVITKKKMRTERKRGPPVQGDLDGFVAFNLSDVQSSFYTLMIGLSLSAMAFLYEFRGGKSNADSTLIIRSKTARKFKRCTCLRGLE